MNISALWVLVFAVVSACVDASIRCSDCNRPCAEDELRNVANEFTKIMSVPRCFSNKANPKWKCILSEGDIDRMIPQTYRYAKCGQCENKAEAKNISQVFNMLFRRSCSPHNHKLYVLELKPVTVSLGCTCVKR